MTKKTTLEFHNGEIIKWIESVYGKKIGKLTTIVPFYLNSILGFTLEITFEESLDETKTNQ